MHAIHGEQGHTGNSACFRPEDLPRECGIRGNGSFQIESSEGLPSWIWVWHPDRSAETMVPGIHSQNNSLLVPRRGGLPTGVFPDGSNDHAESVHKEQRQSADRLTGPIQFVLKLLESWRLETSDAVGLLGFDSEDADHVAAILGGIGKFHGRDVRDRISHLFWIRRTLWSLFRDLEVENEWLREPHPMLDGRSPLSLLLGGSMEDLLLAREYVDVAAGR